MLPICTLLAAKIRDSRQRADDPAAGPRRVGASGDFVAGSVSSLVLAVAMYAVVTWWVLGLGA